VSFPESFHGRHVAPLAAEHFAVEWREPAPRCTRFRVKEHACEFAGTIYELCQAGGLRFIRRTIREAGSATVSETIWMSPTEAGCLWASLLFGQAC
jgi:hypothetical protein